MVDWLGGWVVECTKGISELFRPGLNNSTTQRLNDSTNCEQSERNGKQPFSGNKSDGDPNRTFCRR